MISRKKINFLYLKIHRPKYVTEAEDFYFRDYDDYDDSEDNNYEGGEIMRRSDSNEVLFPVDKISVKLKHQSQRRNDMRFETDPSPTQLPTGKKHALKIYDQFALNAG